MLAFKKSLVSWVTGLAVLVTMLGVKMQLALAAPEIYGFSSTDPNSSAQTIGKTIHDFGQSLVGFVGAASLIAMIVGAFMYAVSHGNERTVETAKKTIMYAIIGIGVALMAELIIQFAIGRLTPAA